MGKITQFAIVFDGERVVYKPGDVVSGHLALTLNNPMEMRGIKIKCVGKSYVHWSERRSTGSGKNRRTTTVHYRASENYFDMQTPLCGKGTAGFTDSKMTLPTGSYTFPFAFQLPPNLPTSFEGGIGYVRYFLKATVDKPWKFDHTGKRAFTVLDMLDLNTEPNARNPSGRNDSKYLCCCMCKSGPIEVDVNTDRTGYVPGETIAINARLENHSNSKVEGSSAKLTQITRFITPRKTKTITRVISEINKEGCAGHSTLTWANEGLLIPAIPPSEMRNCSIIDISYVVQFEAHLRSCSINLRAPVPIQIGTIPLVGVVPFSSAPPTYTATPSAPPEPLAASAPVQPPPPSYMAATGTEGVDIKDEDDSNYLMGGTTYTPQYAYYDWSQSAFTYK